jgi:hypothetical protein
MSSHKSRIEAVLRVLCLEAQTLGKFHVVVETITDVDQHGIEIKLDEYSPIKEACWRALLIGLAGMLSTDQESITLKYLLDLADNHPYDFENVEPEALKRLVARGRAELDAIEDLENRLRSLRDRRLAHLDRKYVNEPNRGDPGNIGVEGLAQGLVVVEKVLDSFARAFGLDYDSFKRSKANYRASLSRALAGPGTSGEL